ncbi:MAG: DMT family transporter [Candidatus Heimdallarchaeaceae archaeon]
MVNFLFIISLLSGLASFAFYNVGFALEKKAISKMSEEIKKSTKTLLKSIITSKLWLFGAFLTIISIGFYYVALLWAPLSAIAPLSGFGIIILVLYAHLDLKETIGKTELFGIFLILGGITVSSYLTSFGDSSITWNQWKISSHSWGSTIMIVGSKRKIQPFDIAIFAGIIAGIQAIVIKGITIWTSETDWNIDLFIAIFYFVGFLGKVSNIMAIYNGVMTIFPIFFGGILLGEWSLLSSLQQTFLGISICVTLIGIVVLSLRHSHSS